MSLLSLDLADVSSNRMRTERRKRTKDCARALGYLRAAEVGRGSWKGTGIITGKRKREHVVLRRGGGGARFCK